MFWNPIVSKQSYWNPALYAISAFPQLVKMQLHQIRPPKKHQKANSNQAEVSLVVHSIKTKLKHNPPVYAMMNAKISQQKFWHCHENGLIKTIQMIPHNL